MEAINVIIVCQEVPQFLKNFPEVRDIPYFRSEHQKVSLIFIEVILIARGDDDNPPRILVNLYRMFLVIIIL